MMLALNEEKEVPGGAYACPLPTVPFMYSSSFLLSSIEMVQVAELYPKIRMGRMDLMGNRGIS